MVWIIYRVLFLRLFVHMAQDTNMKTEVRVTRPGVRVLLRCLLRGVSWEGRLLGWEVSLPHTRCSSCCYQPGLQKLSHPHWNKFISSSDRKLRNTALLETVPKKLSFLTGLCSCWNFITFHLKLCCVLQMRSWWEKYAAGSWQSFKWVKLAVLRS